MQMQRPGALRLIAHRRKHHGFVLLPVGVNWVPWPSARPLAFIADAGDLAAKRRVMGSVAVFQPMEFPRRGMVPRISD